MATVGSSLWGAIVAGSGLPLPGPDKIGLIPVPNWDVPSAVFPLRTRYPWSQTVDPEVTIHTFGSGDAKIEQRFYIGDGLKRFTVNLQAITASEIAQLAQFFRTVGGPLQAFYYDAPSDDNAGTTRYTVRFDNAALSWQQMNDFLANASVTLIQVPDPNAMPWYDVEKTDMRFPSSELQESLLSQIQQLIPMITIESKVADYPEIYLSDRRVTIAGQLYQARLIDFDGISQSLGPSDDARFRLGNADRVITALANDTELKRAKLSFSLFHVGTKIRIDLWTGEVKDYNSDEGPVFELMCSDPIAELTLQYPLRLVDRSCPKNYNDGAACPAALVGAANLETPCDKGFDTPAGCQFHQMDDYFGGIVASPQGVRIRDNGQDGRPRITATSIIGDTVYGQVLPEIYTDIEFPVNCMIVEGRDESDFYAAIGIVGEGPIGSYGASANQLLDGMPNISPFPPRASLGNDPNWDFFAIDESSGVWTTPFKAAGTAFIQIRRTDQKGIQASLPSDHSMQATVALGLSGFMWHGPGIRFTGVLTNPVWIAVNAYLKARGLRYASVADQEAVFDVTNCRNAALICEEIVDSLVYRRDLLAGEAPVTGGNFGYGNYSPGSATEKQFQFIGMLAQQKPLKDWLDEILLNCLGYYFTANGKLVIGIRENASAAEAFTVGNMLFESLQLKPFQPAFNDLIAVFADAQFSFQKNTIRVYDGGNAEMLGGGVRRYEKGQVNLSGTAFPSQAARIAITRLREEIGGINIDEWRTARLVSFKTTVLALNTFPGQVISITHPDAPNGFMKVRITGWKLNSDYSIDVTGRTLTDSMYDMTVGPKPVDVSVPTPPVVQTDFPLVPTWLP